MFDFSSITKTTAALEIILLMLVAAVIAFLVAWIYWSRRYKCLQAEYEQHQLDSAENYKRMEENYQESQTALGKAQGQLMDCNARVKGFIRELREEKTKRGEVETTLGELRTDRNALKIHAAGLESKVADLQASSTLLLTEKATLEADLLKSRKDLKSQTAAAKKLRSELEDLKAGDGVENSKGPQKSGKGKKRKAEEVLMDIAAKRGTINFDRIGTATAGDADDLKLIKGIGPFIEQKLNALGIYTFQQISKFTPEDETSVTKAIEFFPGRIQRDKWTAQAQEFANKD